MPSHPHRNLSRQMAPVATTNRLVFEFSPARERALVSFLLYKLERVLQYQVKIPLFSNHLDNIEKKAEIVAFLQSEKTFFFLIGLYF